MLGKEVAHTLEGVAVPNKQELGHAEVLGLSTFGVLVFGLQSKACSLKNTGEYREVIKKWGEMTLYPAIQGQPPLLFWNVF